jgi:hypothetical protein
MKVNRGALAASLLLVAATGCKVGKGVFQAEGTLYVKNCEGMRDRGSLEMPPPYALVPPQFIAGEPIEDIKRMGRDNRLIIRLQNSGKRIEVNDVLTFDIVSTYEVAKCVRGALKDGQPDYNPQFCSWPPDGRGPPRIRVGLNTYVRANFAPRSKCPQPLRGGRHSVGTAIAGEQIEGFRAPAPGRDGGVAAQDGGAAGGDAGAADPATWEAWISFEQFGVAATFDVPQAQRQPIDREDFKVDFGQRLHATFHIEFTDDRVLKEYRENLELPASLREPLQPADIAGTLDGFFDFDLERGQGAQTFP